MEEATVTKEDAEHHAVAWGEAFILLCDDRAKWHQTGDEYARRTQAMMIVDAAHRGYMKMAQDIKE